MKTKTLSEIRTTLHDLWLNLPAIRERCSEEVVRQHIKLIRYYQEQYDLLLEQARASTGETVAN